MGNVSNQKAQYMRSICRELRALGCTYREIADAVGLKSVASAYDYVHLERSSKRNRKYIQPEDYTLEIRGEINNGKLIYY